MTFQTCSGKAKLVKSNGIVYPSKELIIKAEILQALHIVTQNNSFASLDNYNEWFRLMIPDSHVVKSY